MKPIFLLGWVSFALTLALGTADAQAQNKTETKKEVKKETKIIINGDTIVNGNVIKMPDFGSGPSRDSLVKAMNAMGAEMRKLGDEMKKNTAKFSEKYQQQIQDKMEDLQDEMEQIEEKIEREIETAEVETEDIEAPEPPEVPEAPEAPENEDETANNSGDSSKNKTITIDDDGIHVRTGKHRPKNVVKKPKNSATDFLLLDLGVNTFTNKHSFELPAEANPLDLNIPKSVNVTLHIFRTGVNLYHHNLYTTFGLAYDMHDYRFTKGTTLLPDNDSFKYVESPNKLEKNKLSAQYLTLPVMIHFETNPMRPSRSFKLGVGGWGGFLVNSYRKQVSENFGKQHLHDKFNLNDVNYGVRGQIGYGMFTLYSQYALSPLFKANVGAPELNPVTFGVILNGFKWN